MQVRARRRSYKTIAVVLLFEEQCAITFFHDIVKLSGVVVPERDEATTWAAGLLL